MKHEVYTVNVEVQTPVHVGSGETVNALSYLRVKDMLYVIDDDRWQRWLEAQNVTSRFLQWMDSVAQVMGTPQQRQMSLTRFLTDSLRRQDVEVVAKQVAAYPLRMEECGEPDAVRGLKAHLRDARRRAYLPGSSLKGVIRTALLEDLLLEDDHLNRYLQQPLQQRLKTAAGDRRRLRREVREVWQQMEQALLRGGKQKANFDLLRFVMVSDGEPFAHEQVSLRLVRSENTGRPTQTWLEMVRAGASTRFTLTLLPDAPLKPLGLDDELGEYLLWETLFEVLYERAERRLQRELQYAYPAAVKQELQRLQSLNRRDAPLLCVGWGQGYLGTAVMGLVRDDSPQDYAQMVQNMREALPRRGQGVQPQNFPKTRRTVRRCDEQAVCTPGWVQLHLNET
jgi:CRISPR type III-A-associated RAMP protein Csm5